MIAVGDPRPGGPNALGAPGDVLLWNDRVEAVIEALDHPHYLGPAGGFLLDLGTRGGNDDALRHLPQATGVLPWEAAHYTTIDVLPGDDHAAVQVSGTLDGRPGVPIVTRYEVRPCEPGVRVRTEIANLEPDPLALYLCDAWYWGGRGSLPFTPYPGGGFQRPAFGLSTIDSAMRDFPFLIGGEHEEPTTTYASVGCSHEQLTGFQSESVSGAGTATRLVPPGEFIVFERFIAVAAGSQVGPAVDLALDARRQLFGEAYTTLQGRVLIEDGAVPTGPLEAQILISEGRLTDDTATWTPWTQVRPGPDGAWSARVPVDRTFVVEVLSYGKRAAATQLEARGDGVTVEDLVVPTSGTLRLDARVDGASDVLLAFVEPADADTRETVAARMDRSFATCAPLLGPPHGGSPACNRVLVDGPTTVKVPAGRYEVLAVAGPFSSLTRTLVDVQPGSVHDVMLQVQTLGDDLDGTLSADFHVHGRVSFDSSVPDDDRVRAMLAARLQVIAATDHDAAHDYAEAFDRVGAEGRLQLLVGVESTGHILRDLYAGAPFPQVVGHWNFWPLPYDPDGPWRGAPWDENAEPAQIMDRMVEQGWDPEGGVAQLNHPVEGLEFGRDLGWASALGLRADAPLPQTFDGTPESLFLRRPEGSAFSNADYHTQEVMNATDNWRLPSYRAFWFYLLTQGVVRGGTANSDSHGLTDNVIGSPRTLVFTEETVADFDADAFDAAVRDGRMVGTNGPILRVTAEDSGGGVHGPSMQPFTPGPDSDLRVRVRAAAWVPIEEVRVLVDGEVAYTIREELNHPADPLAAESVLRWEGDVPLAELLPPTGDHFIVVEAGAALVEQSDLDCDGFPDTGDNDGNGQIDHRDVADFEGDADAACMETAGPLGLHAPVTDPTNPGWSFGVVTPGGWPFAFTNAFLIDRDGDGYEGVGR